MKKLTGRQSLITALKDKNWQLAMELKYGGGALEDKEAEEWQYVVNRELQRLAQQVRQKIAEIEA